MFSKISAVSGEKKGVKREKIKKEVKSLEFCKKTFKKK
jgi:hypothetical protein